MKKCPFCGADIEDSARFCLYCMQSLTEKEQILPHQKKKPQWLLIIAAIIALFVSLAFLLYSGQFTTNTHPTDDTVQSTTLPFAPPYTPLDTTPSHIHNYSVANTSIEHLKEDATCTAPAIFYYSCSCGKTGAGTFSHGEPKAHTVVTDTGFPATCKTPGLTDGTHCSACNTVFLEQTQIPTANHTYDNDRDETCNVCNYVRMLNCNHKDTVKLSAVSPTCIAGGLTEGKKCALCDEILSAQTILSPLGHTEVVDSAIAATCTVSGLTEGKHCAACNAVLVAQITIVAKGHAEVIDPAVAATCITEGKTQGSHCSVCNTVFLAQTQVPVTSHTFDSDRDDTCNVCNYVRVVSCDHAETVKLSAVSPTCIASGLTEGEKCILCEELLTTQTFLAPLGHTEVTDQAIAATCTTSGLSEGKHCTTCNTVLVPQVTVAAIGHIEVVDPAIAPTCTTDGKTEGKHCAACNTVFVAQLSIDATGHTYYLQNTKDEYLLSEATCTRPAVYYYSCICGDRRDETFSWGDAKGHTIVTDPGYPATCDTPGLSDKRYCSVCQSVLYPHWEIRELGHTFEPGDSLPTCLVCGSKGTVLVKAPDSLLFHTNNNNTFRIDRITYVIRRDTAEEKWEISVSINGTNLSSSLALMAPNCSLYFYDAHGYWTGYSGSNYYSYVEPNESGTCMIRFRVPNTSDVYKLVIS